MSAEDKNLGTNFAHQAAADRFKAAVRELEFAAGVVEPKPFGSVLGLRPSTP